LQVKYDRNEAFLPQPPSSGKPGAGLPQTLAEVPEVFFQEPLSAAWDNKIATLHTARVIDRINFLNVKKTGGLEP
jgi:hypothetical protein